MFYKKEPLWKKKIVSPVDVLKKIEPGMHIFIGTGAAEPRTLVNCLMHAKGFGLQDLTLIQLVSFGDAISYKALQSKRYRLKTFFSGWGRQSLCSIPPFCSPRPRNFANTLSEQDRP